MAIKQNVNTQRYEKMQNKSHSFQMNLIIFRSNNFQNSLRVLEVIRTFLSAEGGIGDDWNIWSN